MSDLEQFEMAVETCDRDTLEATLIEVMALAKRQKEEIRALKKELAKHQILDEEPATSEPTTATRALKHDAEGEAAERAMLKRLVEDTIVISA